MADFVNHSNIKQLNIKIVIDMLRLLKKNKQLYTTCTVDVFRMVTNELLYPYIKNVTMSVYPFYLCVYVYNLLEMSSHYNPWSWSH